MTVNWSPFVVDEITIVGSRCGPFAPALLLLERGEVDPTILIAKRYPLGKAVEAMGDAQKPGML
ncbi:MAG: alcohol dehydrogenase, partial [Actinomycetota bacterium]|nr:alcohol dehydrogenase [Actinomycetota bacterium]